MLFQSFNQIDIVLASQSPRRKELLGSAEIPFRVWVIPVNEDFPPQLSPEDIAEYLCRQKASAFEGKLDENTLIITADTIVVKDGKILNKARDEEHAFEMLNLLSGTTHEVITGVCLTTRDQQTCFHDITRVTFRDLDDSELSYYIRNFKPFDKAGAYGIQEWIGTMAVTRIEGSWHNVVGLPVARLIDEMKKFITLAFPETDQKELK
jgi:septum formation protein